MSKGAPWPTAVDLFCGCGGVTAGLKSRNFRVVAAVDSDPVACATYRANHPKVHMIEEKIELVDPATIRRDDLDDRDLHLLVVCAPCQPFSQQNRKRGADDRAKLILQAVRFAKTLRPRLIIFENVPGMTRGQFSPVLEELRTGLEGLGYEVGAPTPLDAADYAVPQRRLRCVLLARRGGPPPALPSPTTPRGRRVTVKAAISDLPALSPGEVHEQDPLHRSRKHLPTALSRLQHIPADGGSRAALPVSLRLACHEGRRGYPDVYGRMAWNDVAPTLTTGCTDVTKGRFAHPVQDRAITLREAARLQTFPDSYRFFGNLGEIAAQIGNAVPVRLVQELAPTLRGGLRV